VPAPNLTEPDQAVFDLDPGDEATFDDVCDAALRVWAVLEGMRLRGYPKTSGRRGIHMHVPFAPGDDVARVRAWVKALAEHLVVNAPERTVVARRATHRGRQVAIDYAQNSIARTMAAPYGVRAAPGAPVAAPLAWDEVAAGQIRPADFNLQTMPIRAQAIGDLLAPLLAGDQRLPRCTATAAEQCESDADKHPPTEPSRRDRQARRGDPRAAH
jgi:bifunctional non-homologous end joining protein LigD